MLGLQEHKRYSPILQSVHRTSKEGDTSVLIFSFLIKQFTIQIPLKVAKNATNDMDQPSITASVSPKIHSTQSKDHTNYILCYLHHHHLLKHWILFSWCDGVQTCFNSVSFRFVMSNNITSIPQWQLKIVFLFYFSRVTFDRTVIWICWSLLTVLYLNRLKSSLWATSHQKCKR